MTPRRLLADAEDILLFDDATTRRIEQRAAAALPDGLPAVGASGIPDVWLNVGHAHHGWALSQVAAEALCTMIAGQPSPIDVGALAPQRLR